MKKPSAVAEEKFVPVSGNAIVAWIDILGYRQLHRERGVEFMHDLHSTGRMLMEGMPETVNFMNSSYPGGPPAGFSSFKPSVIGFTDTVVWYAANPSAWQISAFLSVVREFAEQWIAANAVPLRGGIAFGETFIDDAPIRIYGDGPMTAQGLESTLDEIAICIHESVADQWSEEIDVLRKRGYVLDWTQWLRGRRGLCRSRKTLPTIAWPPDEPKNKKWWYTRISSHFNRPRRRPKARMVRAAAFAQQTSRLPARKHAHAVWQSLLEGDQPQGGSENDNKDT